MKSTTFDLLICFIFVAFNLDRVEKVIFSRRHRYDFTVWQGHHEWSLERWHLLTFVEIDCLFKSLVLPNSTYCLFVYGASESDLNIIQLFLDRSHKHRFVSSPVSIKDFLYRQDCKILNIRWAGIYHQQRRINIICVENSVPSPSLIPNDLWHPMYIDWFLNTIVKIK